MQKDKTIYWVSTILTIVTGVTPALFYFTAPFFIHAFHHMGFPDYFRIELGIGKIVGAVLLLLPIVPSRLKEWAYVAFGIVYISGAIAHGTVDGPALGSAPLLPLVFLILSYIYFHKIQNGKIANA